MIRPPSCPICKKPLPTEPAETVAQNAPFCSERCRQIDLLRWFDGRYAIVEPLVETEEQAETPPEE